jgi:hypothetical protein
MLRLLGKVGGEVCTDGDAVPAKDRTVSAEHRRAHLVTRFAGVAGEEVTLALAPPLETIATLDLQAKFPEKVSR